MASLFNLPVVFVDDLLTSGQVHLLTEDSSCPSFGDAAYTLLNREEFLNLVEGVLNLKVEIPRDAEFVAFNG